jgi:hypothetical protein
VDLPYRDCRAFGRSTCHELHASVGFQLNRTVKPNRKGFVAMTNVTNGASEPAMYGVAGFCRSHGISRAFFYKLHREGKGPRFAKCGSRTLISAEAAAEWRRGLEQAA